MINRLLVANRGEIARRVFSTCRSLGISTVAVYADPDADAPHVAEADAAVRLPGARPGETYLRGELLVDAAATAGADAIHPGYGFLSENAGFARAALDAGLTWVGPPPKAIEAMGSKIEAKRLMADAGVPVLGQLDPDAITGADLPVLVKASAGGGGRGMRIVRDLASLPDQVAAAAAEAESAFGDPTVFCEPYLEAGRHIEVQILADQSGAVWALGERECSIQRRHQKVVEEAPSPLVDAEMRHRLREAATAAATAIGYVGAGTVEFLADATGRFFFLEMNTRLQVEHPVTECVTGVDLVAWQLRIAEGAALPAEPPPTEGHAIEVRLYAEDPAQGWQPQAGTLHRFSVPGVDAEFAVPGGSSAPTSAGRVPAGAALRLDAGAVDGAEISTHYDPMLAKLIAWAPTRDEAARRLAAALAGAEIHAPVTNRDLLVRVLRHPEFLAGEYDTGLLERHDLSAPLADPDAVRLCALAAALADAAGNRARAAVLGGLPSGWRNVPSQPQRKTYQVAGETIEVAYRLTREGLVAEGYDGVRLVSSGPERVTLEVGGVTRSFGVAAYPRMVCVDSALGPVTLRPVPRFADPSERVAEGSLTAPMPGTVTAVHVAEGDRVTAGAPLLVLEAMKMQHPVVATEAGVVASLRVTVGSAVDAGSVLAVVERED